MMRVAARRPAPRRRALVASAAGALGLLAVAVWRAAAPPRWDGASPPVEDMTVEAFHDSRRARSRAEGVRPGNEERWVRRGAPTVLLYLHGFVASRAEGELVVDRVAERLGLDVWYARLPGHGTSPEDLGTRRWTEWVDEAHATLRVLAGAYGNVAVVGTSLGGLLATHLAATHPTDVDALVLASPFFAFRRPEARLIDWPGGLALARAVQGGAERRVPLDPEDPEDHRRPGFEDFWYARYPLSAVREVERARRALARDEVFRRVRAPALLLRYPGDVAADPDAMARAFARFGGDGALRRRVDVPRGDHVLLSRWVHVDHARVEEAIVAFLEDALPAPAR